MASGVASTSLNDLIKTTLDNLPHKEFEVCLQYQKYHAVNAWFKKKKKQLDGGKTIIRNIMLTDSGLARHVLPYEVSSINVGEVQSQISAPWVLVEVPWSIDKSEAKRNRGPEAFVDLVDSRRTDARMALANLIEQRAWKSPNSSSDNRNPFGVAYWISKLAPAAASAWSTGSYNATVDADQNFSGRRVIYNDGTYSDTKGGLVLGNTSATATTPRFHNYAATYVSINNDFIKRLSRAIHALDFEAPWTIEDMRSGPASDFAIYMGLDNLVEYEDYARKNNDDLGEDTLKFHGVTVANKIRVQHAPLLDSEANGAIYGLNHRHFFPYVMEGDWMTDWDPMSDVKQRRVSTNWTDGQYQLFCTNVREGGFVLHTALAA